MQTRTKKSFFIGSVAVLLVCFMVEAFFLVKPLEAKAVETTNHIQIQEIAEIRTVGFVGMRYIISINSDVASGLSDVKYGTIMLPADMLGEGGAKEFSLQTKSVLNIETTKWMDDAHTSYAAVLAGGTDGNYASLSEAWYNRPIAARGYVTGKNAQGETVTYYTEDVVVRTLGYVAAMNVENGTPSADSDIIQQIYNSADTSIEINTDSLKLGLASDKANLLYNTNSTNLPVVLKVGGIEVEAAKLPADKITATVSGDAVSYKDGIVTAKKNGTSTLSFTYTPAGKSAVTKTINVTVGFSGASDYVILVPAGMSQAHNDPLNVAVNTIQTQFEKATGVKLPIVTETGSETTNGKYISVGNTNLSNGKLTVSVDNESASAVKTVGNTVFLLGNTDFGTMIGAYELLDDLIGYEYFTNGISIVNAQTSELALPADKNYTPSIETSISPSGIISKNDTLSLAYGMKWWADEVDVLNGGQIHNTFNILPPFSSESSSTAGNFKDHPKWYTYKKNVVGGSQLTYTDSYGRNAPYELCFNARGDSSEYTAMVNAAVAVYTAKLDEDPTFNRASLSVRDNVVWCSCSACQDETPTDAMLEFVNDVCAGIRTHLTNKGDARKDTFRMVFLAYNCVEAAPSSSMALDSYIDVWFADSFGVYTLALNDASSANGTAIGTNKTWTNLKAWADYIAAKGTVDQFLVWTYNSNMYNFFAPYDSFDSMRANYGLFADNGVTAVYNYTHNTQSVWSGLKEYLASKLAFNAKPTDDEWNGWIDAYFNAVYGDAAGTMKTWFNAYLAYADTINPKFNIAESKKNDGNYLASIYMDVTTSEFFTKAELESWLGYANTALGQVPSDGKAAEQIKLERLSPLYLLLEIYGDELPAQTYNQYALTFCQDAKALGIEDLDLNNSIDVALEKYSKVEADYSVVVGAGDVTLDGADIFGNGVTITTIKNGETTVNGNVINLTTGNYTLTVTGSNGETKLVEVIVATKVITTIDEFKETFTGATITGGYYVLGNDIDANGATLGAANKGWNQNAGFSGGAVFDGRGYTISNFTVTGANGIFGTLGDSTVKNVNFKGVTLNGGTALLAYNAYNVDVIDVNVEYVAIGSTAAGLLINGQTGVGSNFINVTLNAAGLVVPNALGNKVNLTERTSDNGNGVVFDNFEIIAKSVTAIGNGGNGADVTDAITAWPNGIILTIKDIVTVEVSDELIAEGGNITLTHDWFKYGETVTVNGTAYTVTTNGELTVTGLNSLTLGEVNAILVATESGRVNYTNVFAVTKVINTADDLDLLNAYANNVTGYYILGGNIDATAKTITNTAYAWSTGFSGTLDGRGYTINGLTVSGHGIFTRIAGGTIKNLNFTDVNLNGGTLFAYLVASGINISDVDVEISALTPISGPYNGILFSRQIEAANASLIKNVTVDVVKGANVPNVFGQIKTTSLTFENVVINATTLDILSTDSNGANVTELTGVTTNLATVAEVADEVIVDLSKAGAVTFKHTSFKAGDVLTLSVNGTTLTATAVEGSVTFDLASAGLVAGTKYSATVMGDNAVISYTNVFAVTKVITSAADITALSHTNAPTDAGYYILTGNVDCNGATFNSGSSWNDGFAGTVDGRGYKISNFTVSNWGIFGRVVNATIKNIVFDEVTFSGATALFGRMSAGANTIDNITVNVAANTATVADETGILFGRETPANTALTNITINIADGVNIYKLLGNSFASSNVSINVSVEYADNITYIYGTSTTAPAGVTVTARKIPAVVEEVTTKFFGENGGNVTLKADDFTLGTQVTCGGVTYTVETAGEITVPVSGTVADTTTVICEIEGKTLKFTNVFVVTKILKTVDDLKTLNWNSTLKNGYYVLTGDIDCAGATFGVSGKGWSASAGFAGTVDGNGFAIKNFTMSGYNVTWFGNLSGGTVKNLDFENATIGGGAAIIACMSYSGTIENVNVTLAAFPQTTESENGVFISRQTTNITYRNVTIDANGLNITNLFGCEIKSAPVCENFVVNNVGDVVLGYTGTSSSTTEYTTIPAGLTINKNVVQEVLESTNFAAAQNGATTITLSHESFTSGANVSVTWNGVTKDVAAGAGTLTLTLADFNVTELGQSQVVTETATHKITFTEVWNVTKVLTTKDDLKLLSTWTDTKNTGYYILNGNIACGWGASLNTSTIGAWSGNSGFKGTLDGRGYTISQFNVGGFGLFGSIGTDAVIKNINFTSCTVDNSGVFFARLIYGGTFENITVTINQYNNTTYPQVGFFAAEGVQNSTWKNITVNANEQSLGTIVGASHAGSNTYTNVVFNNVGNFAAYGYSDGNYYNAGTTAIAKPEGITVNLASQPVEELTVEATQVAEGGATTITLSHESFTIGTAVSVT